MIQNGVFNAYRTGTTIVRALTSNLKRAATLGNVLLAGGEANLPKPSVVLVSQFLTVGKAQLVEYIGSLSGRRMQEIAEGVRLLTEPWDIA